MFIVCIKCLEKIDMTDMTNTDNFIYRSNGHKYFHTHCYNNLSNLKINNKLKTKLVYLPLSSTKYSYLFDEVDELEILDCVKNKINNYLLP